MSDTSRSHPAVRRGSLAAVLVLALIGALAPTMSSAAPAKKGGLSKHDQQQLAKSVANGDKTVMLLLAAKPGRSQAVADGVRAQGGSVRIQDKDVDYVRAVVPTARAEQVAALPDVQSADVDEVIPLEPVRPDGQEAPTPQTPPGSSTPAVNPYMPIGDTGAAQFVDAHPTWDGRNITIGILDTGVDLDHPALQETTTGDRKIVDWVTYTHPFDDNDPTWIRMTTQVTGPTFTVDNATYTAPSGGSFRFGTLNERDSRLGGELGNDVNRDGNPAGSSGLFGVLWDAGSKVWVDVDQDLSFADEGAMTNYGVNHDVGHFGADNGATDVVEELPFVVQIDGKNKVVNIGIVSGQHGTHVAGIMTADGLFGGEMRGAAPGANLVSVRVCLFIAGCTSHALIEGMIFVIKQAGVDVVNMSIGGLPSLNDANNTRAVIYDRLINKYHAQMFISAGNSGPGENTVGDPSVATQVMSVGASITDATWESNYGSSAPAPGVDNQHPFSSRGPREDGGFKPNLIAPGAAVSSTPLWQPGGPVAGTYTLPPGYSMLNGTSMASPQATGAAALLLSAAGQAGVQHLPDQLRQAMNSSTRFIDNYGAFEQGNGLIQVDDAWALLATNKIKPLLITSAVAVNTALSSFLATPGVGVGIHDREGVELGESYTRTYTFRRTSGGGGSKTYNLSWVGNDGTFSIAPSSISLPLNQPVNLAVTVDPGTLGAHSAILNLNDPSIPGIEYQTLNTVIVPFELTAGTGYSQVVSDTVGRNQALRYFFRIPAETPAFKVDFSGPDATPGTGQARFLRFHPYGVGVESNSSLSCYSPPVVPGGSCAGSPNSRTTTLPTAGVWEVTVEARRTSDLEFTPFTLTASILGASVEPNPDVIAEATVGVPIDRSYTITNLLGPFTGRAVGTTLGSALRDRFSIANLEQQSRDVEVTTGTTSLRATIGNPSDPAADLDLFVFNCTTGPCVLAGQSADGDSEESVTIANPAAGTWTIVVDGFAVPAGTTRVRLRRCVHQPGLWRNLCDGCERAAAEWCVMDGPGNGHRQSGARSGPRSVREC